MQKRKNFLFPAAIIFIFVLLIGSVQLYNALTPIHLEGPTFQELEQCAVNQKYLFQEFEAYREKHGQSPNSVEEFTRNGFPATQIWKCSASNLGYKVHIENYGKPDAVFIEDLENQHSGTFMLWLRGYKPQVQTMGDGTIQLFKGGALMTMDATK